MTKIALYPGTFDPITNGHTDIIMRAARHLVDKLIEIGGSQGWSFIEELVDEFAKLRGEIWTKVNELFGRFH